MKWNEHWTEQQEKQEQNVPEWSAKLNPNPWQKEIWPIFRHFTPISWKKVFFGKQIIYPPAPPPPKGWSWYQKNDLTNFLAISYHSLNIFFWSNFFWPLPPPLLHDDQGDRGIQWRRRRIRRRRTKRKCYVRAGWTDGQTSKPGKKELLSSWTMKG